MRILIVEDEPRIAADLRAGLERAGYVAESVGDGEAAWFKAETETYDAMVLDLGLRASTGSRAAPPARGRRAAAGADPHRPRRLARARRGDRRGRRRLPSEAVRMEELVARLRAILRRTAGHASPVLRAGAVELDTRTRAVTVEGREIDSRRSNTACSPSCCTGRGRWCPRASCSTISRQRQRPRGQRARSPADPGGASSAPRGRDPARPRLSRAGRPEGA